MAIVSFDEWKRKKAQASALNARGGLREDIALREEYGFDLCVFISEETNASDPDDAHIEQLWNDLRALMQELPHEHAHFYFRAFEAFFDNDETAFFKNFDLFLESEQRLNQEILPCDWWIDHFIWVFSPPFPGMLGRCSELFFKHWPLCALGWVCEALEQSESVDENIEHELDLLMLAIQSDPDCYLAQYLVASIFYDQRQWKSAIPYFEKASRSTMYSEDAAFFFDYAWAAQKANRHTLSMQLYQRCLSIDERYPCAINNLGCVFLRLERYDDAIKEFRRAITLNLDGPLPYRNIVAALERQEKFDECIAFIEQNLPRLGKRYEIELERLKSFSLGLERSLSAAIGWAEAFPNSADDDGEEQGFAKRMLEDWLEDCIERNEKLFGRKLRIYEDENGYGRQYYIAGAGRIDLLCIDEDTRELCVLAVHNGRATERALLAIWQQIAAVRKALAKRWQQIRGFIICAESNETLRTSVKTIRHEAVELYEYRFNLQKS